MHLNNARHRYLIRCLLTVMFALATWGGVSACNVPVFRFALERWRPTPYRLTLVHRGPLSDADQALATRLLDQQDAYAATLEVRLIDVTAEPAEADAALVASVADDTLPALCAQYPQDLGNEAPFWKSKLSEAAVSQILDSPVRTELVSRLASGQTAVWLVLSSGDPAKDQATTTLLTQELKRLEGELELPDFEDDLDALLPGGPPVRIAFSILQVPRHGEEALVAMLLHSEPDLAGRADPLVFPVFGRGRALFPLVGAGITSENITLAAEFLVGACGCEVKEQNPGFDLLLAADWTALLEEQGMKLTDLPAVEESPSTTPELVPIPAGTAAKVATNPVATAATINDGPRPANDFWKWIAGVSLTCATVGLVAWRLALRGRR